MKFRLRKINVVFTYYFFFSILVLVGCSKDTDLLNDILLEKNAEVIVEDSKSNTVSEQETQSISSENSNSENSTDQILETRTISFPPTNDAHVQSGKGYNQNIIRLEENFRTSYLMFDLRPIASINGVISKATLQFTINSDDGNGHITVNKGQSNDWSEENLSNNSAPESGELLGEVIKEYKIGATETIELDVSKINTEIATLVLKHTNGNDLAFASKEHAYKIGPKLVVIYNVPQGSDQISIDQEETETDNSSTEESQTEESQTEQSSNEEPIAIADATPSSGGVPLEVTFIGNNSSDDDEIKTFLWNFSDGSTSTAINPKHTFTEVGSYEVELTVTDGQGVKNNDTVIITVTENENEAPIAKIEATPISGEAPLEVSLKGSGSTDDISISSYAWDYKDGQKGNGIDPTHTFVEPDTYEVSLTVMDENGLKDTASVTITVTEPANQAPVAVATANKTSGVAPLHIQFTGNQSTDDKEITSYSWNFKDGSTSTTSNPSHTFTSAGTYDVELSVKDEKGLSSIKVITITVSAPQNQEPVAKVTANTTTGEAPLQVQFYGNNSTDDKAITSYSWNFKDGSTSTTSNPSHTFTSAGIYTVELTVKDAEGASNSKTITITVTEPESGTILPGFYVSASGKATNDGKSPSKPWSLRHALYQAKAGDIVYIKAGTYTNEVIVGYNSGSVNNPIKFIGYKNTPGDISSNGSSTFDNGDQLDANTMPLLKGGSSTQGIGLDLNGSHVHIENLQITNYLTGVNAKGNNGVLKNVIVTNNGQQTNNNSQNGTGIIVQGNNSLVENCFNLNSNSIGITLKGTVGSTIKNTKVYSTNPKNPGGYYMLISSGARNNTINNCVIYRHPNSDLHRGHGIILKDQATNNTIKNTTTYNTGVEVNFSGVHSNTFNNITINGSYSKDSGEFTSNIRVINGAHDNDFNNIRITDARYAINFHDFNDGYQGSGGDKQEGGHNNIFTNIIVDKAKNIVGATSPVVGAAAFSNNNEFINCSFKNITREPFFSYQKMNGTKFTNCSFVNIPYHKTTELFEGGSFPINYSNCTFSNVGFQVPN